MKKFLKDLFIWLLMFAMVFAVVYMLMIAADAEYEISQERERVYFEKVEDMRKWEH